MRPLWSALCLLLAATAAESASTARHRFRQADLSIELADEAAGLGLVRLGGPEGKSTMARGSDDKPLLWRLELRSDDKTLKPITLDNQVEAKRSAAQSPRNLELRWEGIALDGESNALDVAVTIQSIPPEWWQSAWRITVANRSKRYGVWDVFFPVFQRISPDGPPAVAVPRSNWGLLYRDGKARQDGSYPSCNWPMQFLCVNQGESGLYLACHDPEAWPKRFSLTPGGEFCFQVHAPNQGVAGAGYEQAFPIAVGCYRGDWWEGARAYRRWAIASAPWARKGPVAARKDTPKKLTGLGLWMLGGGFAKDVVPKMAAAAKLFDVPIGIHWYNWHEIPFDTYYPNYFPTKPGFAEGVRELTGKGIVAMPYINGRLWDSGNENFKGALPFACKDPAGKPYIETYGSKRPLAVMCPFTRFWQDKVNDICHRLMTECGVNAIYIDQIAAAGPRLCYDKTHGHPLGGGSWWADGYRDMLTRIRQAAHADGRDVILTTENNAECYMDTVDAFLTWNPRDDREIPMMTAVYSGYTTYFSSPSAVGDELRAFAASQGRDFLFGCQLGWMGFELLDPKNREKAEYLRDLAKHRLAAKKFMELGQLLGEIKPWSAVPSVEVEWGRSWGGKGAHKAVLPAVMATVWRAPDGELAIVATNWDDQPRRFRYIFDMATWGGSLNAQFSPKPILFWRLTGDGEVLAGYSPQGFTIERAEVLGPREVLVLALRPAPSRWQVIDELAAEIDRLRIPRSRLRFWDSMATRCDKLWAAVRDAKGADPRLLRSVRQCVADLVAADRTR